MPVGQRDRWHSSGHHLWGRVCPSKCQGIFPGGQYLSAESSRGINQEFSSDERPRLASQAPGKDDTRHQHETAIETHSCSPQHRTFRPLEARLFGSQRETGCPSLEDGRCQSVACSSIEFLDMPHVRRCDDTIGEKPRSVNNPNWGIFTEFVPPANFHCEFHCSRSVSQGSLRAVSISFQRVVD